MRTTIRTDTLIIGAGPIGLFQVFELGLLDVKADIVDALPQVGGQCAELYPDKPIYDIPALPVVSAQELIDRLLQQIRPFSPTFHLAQEVTHLKKGKNGIFYLKTTRDIEFEARTVIIAGGIGPFQPRRLKLKNLDDLEGKSVHYKVTEPALFHNKNIVILGGGDSALDWALELQSKVRQLTLIHRSQRFRAAPATVSRFFKLRDDGAVDFMQGNVVDFEHQGDALTALEVLAADSHTRRLELDHLLIFFGMSPKLGPISEWGLDSVKNQIAVDTERFETSMPGVFAVGDINVYPGKKKLILSGFHEAALAAFAVRQYLYPEEKIHLQYTTTSSKLHERLGVKGE